MKSFFDYSKNELPEEPKGSSKIITGKPNPGDKFVLVNNQFNLTAGSIVEISEETGTEYNVGFGLSSVNLKTENGIITLKGSTKLIQELFNQYVEPIKEKEEPKIIVVNKTVQQKIVEQGIPGQRGEVGSRGPMGPVGDKGAKGDKGDKGDKGEQGIPGEKGEQGIQGLKGDKGDKGDKGERGDKGDKGDRGGQGLPGVNGKDGKPGSTGPKGDRGEPGPEGKPGPTGATGKQGEKGDRGDRGEKGEQGPAGKNGKPGLKGVKGDKGDKGDSGDSGVVSVSYPLVYDLKKKHLSFDSTKIEKLISSLSSNKGTFDLTSLGGGAVGIQFNKAQIIKSVNDINFTGSGVTVTRKGKNVEVNISGGTGGGVVGGISGPYVISISGSTGAVNLRGQRGITYTIAGNTHSFGIDYSRGGATFPIRTSADIDKSDVVLLQDRSLIANPKANEMYLVTMDDMLNYFNNQTSTVNYKSSTSILVADGDDNTTKRVDYSTFTSTIASLIPGITGATGATGAQGPQGNTGATGATPTDYVISFNGLTGAVTGVTTGTTNTFIVRQNFSSGISASGSSFSGPINGTTAVFTGTVTGTTFIGGLSGNATGIIISPSSASVELFPLLCTSSSSTVARADTTSPRVSIIPSTGQLTAPVLRISSTISGGVEITESGTITSTTGDFTIISESGTVGIGDVNDVINFGKLVIDNNTATGATLQAPGELRLIGTPVSITGAVVGNSGASFVGNITAPNIVNSVNGMTGNVTIEENIGIFLDATPDLLTTGKKGFKQIPYNCQVLEWYVIGGATGTIEFDVKKSSFANYPSTSSIVGSDYPKLTSQFKNSNTGVTAWSGLSGGDIVDFVINSNTDVESVGLFIKIRRI